jgi:hypothetical protein
VSRKRQQKRVPSAAEREAEAERKRQAQADAEQQAAIDAALEAMDPQEREQLEALRAQETAEREARAMAERERGLFLIVEWAACPVYEPRDLAGRVRLLDQAPPICPRCSKVLPLPLTPEPPLYRMPGEGDPYANALPPCPNTLSAIRARQAEKDIERRVGLLAQGTAFA